MRDGAVALEAPRRAREVAPSRVEKRLLGMAELGLSDLSQGWLLRRAGDVHWRLIADAIGIDAPDFRDARGRRVYAAFCAVSLSLAGRARPGEALEIRSTLGALSRSRLLSRHVLVVGGRAAGRVEMISAFLAHGRPGANRSLLRTAPLGLPPLAPIASSFGAAAQALAKTERPHLGVSFGEEPSRLGLIRPAPADFNAVGLLYFPSYPELADRARWSLDAAPPPAGPVRRDIVYLGNIDLGETILVHCGALRETPGGAGHWTRLERADGAPLARMVTLFGRAEDGPGEG